MDDTFSQALQNNTDSESHTNTHVTTQEDSSSNIYNSNLLNNEVDIVSFPLEVHSGLMSQDIAQRRENFEDDSETTRLYWMPPKVLERDCMRTMPRKIPGKYISSTSIKIIIKFEIDVVCLNRILYFLF